MSKKNELEDKGKTLHISSLMNSTCTGENSAIFVYGKGYTSFEELEQDHNEIQKNPISLLYILKKNGC